MARLATSWVAYFVIGTLSPAAMILTPGFARSAGDGCPAGLAVGTMIVSCVAGERRGVAAGEPAVDELLRVGRVGRQEDVGGRALLDLRLERGRRVGRDRERRARVRGLVGGLRPWRAPPSARRRRRSSGRRPAAPDGGRAGRRGSRRRPSMARRRRAGAAEQATSDAASDRHEPIDGPSRAGLPRGRDLDDHVGRLDDARRPRRRPRSSEVVDRLGRHQAHEPVRPGHGPRRRPRRGRFSIRVTIPGNRLRADWATIGRSAGGASALVEEPGTSSTSTSRWPPSERAIARRPSASQRRSVSTETPEHLGRLADAQSRARRPGWSSRDIIAQTAGDV